MKIILLGLLLNVILLNITPDNINSNTLTSLELANAVGGGVLSNYIGQDSAIQTFFKDIKPTTTDDTGNEQNIFEGILSAISDIGTGFLSGLESVINLVLFTGGLLLSFMLSLVMNPITYFQTATNSTNAILKTLGYFFTLIIVIMNLTIVNAFIGVIKGRGVKQ